MFQDQLLDLKQVQAWLASKGEEAWDWGGAEASLLQVTSSAWAAGGGGSCMVGRRAGAQPARGRTPTVCCCRTEADRGKCAHSQLLLGGHKHGRWAADIGLHSGRGVG